MLRRREDYDNWSPGSDRTFTYSLDEDFNDSQEVGRWLKAIDDVFYGSADEASLYVLGPELIEECWLWRSQFPPSVTIGRGVETRRKLDDAHYTAVRSAKTDLRKPTPFHLNSQVSLRSEWSPEDERLRSSVASTLARMLLPEVKRWRQDNRSNGYTETTQINNMASSSALRLPRSSVAPNRQVSAASSTRSRKSLSENLAGVLTIFAKTLQQRPSSGRQTSSLNAYRNAADSSLRHHHSLPVIEATRSTHLSRDIANRQPFLLTESSHLPPLVYKHSLTSSLDNRNNTLLNRFQVEGHRMTTLNRPRSRSATASSRLRH